MPVEPSSKEQEYFARLEIEQKKKWMAEKMEKLQADEKQKLKELHFMKCPKCGYDLAEMEFMGVKIDRCVSCNGTWFDDGELQLVARKHDEDLLSKMMKIFR